MLRKEPGQKALDGGVERRALGKLGLKHVRDVVQRAGHGRVQDNVRGGDVLGGAEGAEFELVAGEGKGARPIAVGEVARDVRQHGDADFNGLHAVVRSFLAVGDGPDDP